MELSDPSSGRIFWADELCGDAVDSFSMPPLLAARIVAGLDAEIHVIERNRALLTQPAHRCADGICPKLIDKLSYMVI